VHWKICPVIEAAGCGLSLDLLLPFEYCLASKS
jgi:hypothetical protein